MPRPRWGRSVLYSSTQAAMTTRASSRVRKVSPSGRLESALAELQLACVLRDRPDLAVAKTVVADGFDFDRDFEADAVDRRQGGQDLVVDLLEVGDDLVWREVLRPEIAGLARYRLGTRRRLRRRLPFAGLPGVISIWLTTLTRLPDSGGRLIALGLRALGADDQRRVSDRDRNVVGGQDEAPVDAVGVNPIGEGEPFDLP